jgi:hypothetical protein
MLLKKNPVKNYSSKFFEDLCYNEIKKFIVKSNSKSMPFGNIKTSASVSFPIRVNFGGRMV